MAGLFLFLVPLFTVFLTVSSENGCSDCKSLGKCDTVIGNTNTVCRYDTIGLTRFQDTSKALQICDGKRWLQVPLKGRISSSYGGRHNPGASCGDIYEKKKKDIPNGVYWVKMSGHATSFPVYCDMSAGGWTMVFKAVSGVAVVPGDLWLNPLTSNEDILKALDVTNTFKQHYKNKIVKYWTTFNPSEVRVVLYKKGRELIQMKYNGKGSTSANWYTMSRMVESPWTDVSTEVKNVFSIKGACHPKRCRSFMINRNYGGCGKDSGWLLATISLCTWERRFPFASIIYSKVGTYTNWNTYANVGYADVMAVYVR